MHRQVLTLTLDAITACDYLAWVADSEPATLGNSLASITMDAEPVGRTVDIALAWNVSPPAAELAVGLAGFPLIPEVASVEPAMPTPAETRPAHRPSSVIELGDDATDQREAAPEQCCSTLEGILMPAP